MKHKKKKIVMVGVLMSQNQMKTEECWNKLGSISLTQWLFTVLKQGLSML